MGRTARRPRSDLWDTKQQVAYEAIPEGDCRVGVERGLPTLQDSGEFTRSWFTVKLPECARGGQLQLHDYRRDLRASGIDCLRAPGPVPFDYVAVKVHSSLMSLREVCALEELA
jgi:hypothetical protein